MASRFILDTCTWLDLSLDPASVNPQVREMIQGEPYLHLATISYAEVTRKVSLGQLRLDSPIDHWLRKAANPHVIRSMDISIPVALEAYALPGEFHKDPADRLIVATARVHQLTIVTSDRKILRYPHVQSIASR